VKIAIAGKGGSGKTTIAGTLARLLVRQGEQNVLAIDADSNPNLALTLGIAREQATLRPLGRDVLERVQGPDGKTRTVLARPVEAVVREYGIPTPGGVTMLLMGRVEHAGVG
jgi:CO dehydrogenase maturation factor